MKDEVKNWGDANILDEVQRQGSELELVFYQRFRGGIHISSSGPGFAISDKIVL